jgi:hypothetical protein
VEREQICPIEQAEQDKLEARNLSIRGRLRAMRPSWVPILPIVPSSKCSHARGTLWQKSFSAHPSPGSTDRSAAAGSFCAKSRDWSRSFPARWNERKSHGF